MEATERPHPIAPAAATPPSPPPDLSGLRVALVHDWINGRRGGEKCLEVLCEAFPHAQLFTLIHEPGSAGPTIGRMQIRTSPLQRIPGVQRHYRKLLPLMPLAARAWRPGAVDLVVSLSHCVAKAVRVPAGVPHVCYCFTPMRYAWDGRDAYLDGWSGRSLTRGLAGWTLDRLRAWDRATARNVSHFVAISETVRERIERCYDRESVVIQPPVDTDFYTPGDTTPAAREPYYLCVSALVPYKRLDHAVRACTALGRRLVVIGAGPDRERLEELAGPTVEFLGWQPDAVVRDHLRRCRALLFPGVEDFGIVPIEALACGTPVLALGIGGAAETVDDRVGRVFGDRTAEGLLAAILGWERDGMPHDPTLARQRAEALATPVFRDRLLRHLAGVVADRAAVTAHAAPPAPHVLRRRAAARRRGAL